MNRKLVVCSLLVLVCAGCKKDEVEDYRQFWAPEPVPPALTVGASLEETRASLAELHKLKPDARFLGAFARVGALLGKGKVPPVEARYEDERWTILVGGESVGSVAAFYPGYGELFGLLEQYAGQRLAKAALSDGAVEKGPAMQDLYPLEKALAELHRLDAEWNKAPRRSLLVPAAQALAALQVQFRDDFQAADELAAHALAMTALASAAEPESSLPARVLMAETFLASRVSLELALKLPEGDPLVAFVLRDDDALKLAAEAGGASPEARYLRLLRLVEMNRHVEEAASRVAFFPKGQKSPSILAPRLSLAKFRIAEGVYRLLPWLVLDLATAGEKLPVADKIRVETGADPELMAVSMAISVVKQVEDDQLVGALDEALKPEGAAPSIFDADMEKAMWRGFSYTGLYRIARLYVHGLYARDGAVEDLALYSSARGEYSRAFRQWYDLWVRSRFDQPKPGRIVGQMKKLPSILGSRADYDLWNDLQNRSNWSEPTVIVAARVAAERMDSRVEDRLRLADMAEDTLFDMVLLEKLYASIVLEAPNRFHHAEVRHFKASRDGAALREMLDNPAVTVYRRARIIETLARMGLADRKELVATFEKLTAEVPDDWDVRRRQVEFLERLGKNPEARAVVRDWLAKYSDTPGLAPVIAQTKIARAFYREGAFEEGLKAVDLAMYGGWAGSMKRRVMLLSALGRIDDALAQVELGVKRYPKHSLWPALMAEIHWRAGDYEAAADALEHPVSPLELKDWGGNVAKYFLLVFKDAPDDRVALAVESLHGRKIDPYALTTLADALSDEDRHELAYRVLAPLKMSGQRAMDTHIRAARELSRARGAEEATRWLKDKVAPGDMNLFGMMLYNEGADGLLFEFVPDPPEKNEHADFLWVLRAAAVTRRPKLAEKYGSRVLEHFKGNGYSYYHQIGRFLMDLVTLDELLSLGNTPDISTEVAYYAGLKAVAEGRYKDASNWFRVVAELGQTREGEYRWALNVLGRWTKRWRYLE